MRADAWAKEHASREYSQCGEDGILAEIFRVLGDGAGFCVEFGASNGVGGSNTHSLVRSGWKGVLIEPDPDSYALLVENMRPFPQVTCLQAFVGLDGEKALDSLLEQAGAPTDIDVLSIDVDGIDYHVWDSLRMFTPKVVVIEYNPSIPNDVDFVQRRDERVTHGSSIRSLVALAGGKGYELAAVTDLNAVFVRDDLFAALELEDNSIDDLRDDTATKTTLFQGFDGTLMLAGNKELLWHYLPIDEARLQALPRALRRYPGRLSPVLQVARHAWSIGHLIRSGRSNQQPSGPAWRGAPTTYVSYHKGRLLRTAARLVGVRRRPGLAQRRPRRAKPPTG